MTRRTSPTFERALCLSTFHIVGDHHVYESEHLGFDDVLGAPRVNHHDCGWIVFLITDDARPVPEWFVPIRDLAVREQVSFIVFDSAGQILDSLPTYDW